MDGHWDNKSEMDAKLEREESHLKLLNDTINRSSQLTSGMVGILSSFELRLSILEQTILPLYHETGILQKQQENIEKTLSALDHVISFYNVSVEVEPIMREGPSGSNLVTFLQSMDRLRSALAYFEKNPQSVELENVQILFNSGVTTLNEHFQELLLRHSSVVPAILIMDLISMEEEMSGQDLPSLNQLPEGVREEMMGMADWLILNSRDEYKSEYARVRAGVFTKSLHGLKEYQRSASGGSTSGMVTGSPVMRSKFGNRHDTPSKRHHTKRFQHAFEKRANKMLIKASQTIEQSTGLALGPKRPGPLLESREDHVEDRDVENYLTLVMAFLKLSQSEMSLMAGIIHLQHQKQTFEYIIKDALDMVVQDGETIANKAKRCINRHDFTAVLVIFPILKHLLGVRPEFERTLEGCEFSVRNRFASLLNTLHFTGLKALEDFVESIRAESNSQLPKDGTVHELTSNTLTFLEQLTDYVDTIGGMLSQDQGYSNLLGIRSAAARADKNRALLGIYIKKVLVQLNFSLVSRSDAYSDSCLRAIFRLNNNHYVLKALQQSGLLELVQLSEPDCHDNYRDMVEEQKRVYAQSWAKVLSYIWSNDDVPVAILQAGKLRDKDRQAIKDKFAGFNKEIEEIQRVQRGFSVPDVELREALKQENKEYIFPKYKAFYEKYSKTPFTKNLDKYIKYSPADVLTTIDTFFDVAA